MKTYGIIQFEEHEREQLERALQGLEHLIEEEKRGEPYFPLRKFMHMIQQEESFDGRHLEELTTVLTACIQKLAPETDVEWWSERAGSLSARDALEGLAATRQQQVKLLQEARDLVWEARDLAGEAPPTKAKREAVGV